MSDTLNRPVSKRTNTFLIAMIALVLMTMGLGIGFMLASRLEQRLQAHALLSLERDSINHTLAALALLRGGEPERAVEALESKLHFSLVVFEPLARELYGTNLPESLVKDLEQVQQYRVAYPFMSDHPIQKYLDSFEGTSTNTAGLPPVIFPIIARRTAQEAFSSWTSSHYQTNGPTCKIAALRDGTFYIDIYGVVSSNLQDSVIETLAELSPSPKRVIFWKSEPDWTAFITIPDDEASSVEDADWIEIFRRETREKRIRAVLLEE